MKVVSKRNMMAQAKGKKTNFAYGETYDVSEQEAKMYKHRKWVLSPEDAKKENILPPPKPKDDDGDGKKK